jgi:hypothetical protein
MAVLAFVAQDSVDRFMRVCASAHGLPIEEEERGITANGTLGRRDDRLLHFSLNRVTQECREMRADAQFRLQEQLYTPFHHNKLQRWRLVDLCAGFVKGESIRFSRLVSTPGTFLLVGDADVYVELGAQRFWRFRIEHLIANGAAMPAAIGDERWNLCLGHASNFTNDGPGHSTPLPNFCRSA